MIYSALKFRHFTQMKQISRHDKIIELINAEETFEAYSIDGGFIVKIKEYLPYCCTAIHSGSNFREELKTKIIHNDYQRWYEEDPHTGYFIGSMPITITGCDSRYEYDLNREPFACIYKFAWGVKVWKKERKMASPGRPVGFLEPPFFSLF